VLLQSEFVTLEMERRSTLLLLKLKVLDLKLVVPLPPLHELKREGAFTGDFTIDLTGMSTAAPQPLFFTTLIHP
jgi:hypothetical protein